MNKPALFNLTNGLKEADALIVLTTKQLGRNEVIAMVQWEAARFLYASGKLPDFWQRTAAGKRPETPMPMGLADEIFGHRHFPKPWEAIPPKARLRIVTMVAADQTPAARILTGNEVGMQTHRFTKAYSKAMDGLRAGEPYPKSLGVQKMDDGGFVALIRFYPGCGWNHISKDLVAELKKLEWPQYGRANGKDIEWHKTVLKGFAAHWLSKAGVSEPEQNKRIFPERGIKGDCKLLRRATKRAADMMEEGLKALNSRVSEWTSAQAEMQAADLEFFDSLRQVIKKPRSRRKKSPP